MRTQLKIIAHVSLLYDGPGECVNFSDYNFCSIEHGEFSVALQSGHVFEHWQEDFFYADACQYDAPWHLQAISQDSKFIYDNPQPATKVYVLDTWIDINHYEFEGRAYRGASFSSGRHHHGTHVSGLVGSKTYGVNRNARIIEVQVLNSKSWGTWSTILKGLDWVNKQEKGIINLSITGRFSKPVNIAVNQMIKKGWKIVTAAGNNADDACKYSPGSSSSINVGSYDEQFHFSNQFSNHGECVDVLAPGHQILSLYPGNLLAFSSGTSMSAPLVAGIWSLFPNDDYFSLLEKVIFFVKETPECTTNKSIILPHESLCLPYLLVQ